MSLELAPAPADLACWRSMQVSAEPADHRRAPLRRAALGALLALLALLAVLASAPRASAMPLTAVKHVFVIVLENESESTTFGPGAPAPYLAQTLPSEGVFVPNYYAVGHNSLDNYIAMISGQAPNPDTEADCRGKFTPFPGPVFGENEQVEGEGCVYPRETKTVANQLQEEGDTWRGYMQSMPSACSHPAVNAADEEQGEGPNDTYATRHDPFVWFRSIIEDEPNCDSHVVKLEELEEDLEEEATTRNFSFITPDVCSDGHDSTCKNPAELAGFAGINAFLEKWVPKITGSAAFKKDGLLIVTFDEASDSDTSACCGESTSGGGQIGAVMLSPFITPDSTSPGSYNHYSMLASIEDAFELPLLGDTKEAGTTTFENGIFGLPKTPAPTVLTGAASSVTLSTATLNATVNPNGRMVTSCTIEYGATSAYGSSAPCSPSPGSGSAAVAVSTSLTGLTAGTTYHFRVLATNAGGTSDGSDQQFTTTAVPIAKPVAGPPPALVCPSGRSVTIKLPTGRKRLSHVTVTVNKHKVKVTGAKKHPQVVLALTGRSAAEVTVIITGRQGKHRYKAVHHYKSCHVG